MLHLTAVCNAGVYLEQDGFGLLIDGICCDTELFFGTSPQLFAQMLQKSGMFSTLQACMFTHLHEDHFDTSRTAELAAAQPAVKFWIPDEKTFSSGRIQAGPFSVSYYEVPHIGAERIRHVVFRITAGAQTVYLAGDAEAEPAQHRPALDGIVPDYMFVNPLHLSDTPFREYVCALQPGEIFVHHLSKQLLPAHRYLRRLERIRQRCSGDLPATTAIETYPLFLK